MTLVRRTLAVLATLLLAAGISAAPASAEPVITITFVRHAESEANAAGVIDTSVPGAPITPKGEQQAKEAAAALSRTPHDGIYASTIIRTQQTAQPLADELGEQITVLPGLREIEAGVFEGRSDADAINGYFQPLRQWLAGDRLARIPGSVDGNEFDARFDESVDDIYRSGRAASRRVLPRCRDFDVDDDERPQSPARARRKPTADQHRPRHRRRQPGGWLDAPRLERNEDRLDPSATRCSRRSSLAARPSSAHQARAASWPPSSRGTAASAH